MKILLVIDMLNGFCRKGFPLSLGISTKKIESYISTQIEDTINNNGIVIFICDSHKPSDPEINNPYPPHCMEGSVEADIIDTLSGYTKNATVIKKHTLSIMFNTGLEEMLKKVKPSIIEVTGVCTDICDLFAVYELRIRGYNVYVSRNGVLALDSNKQDDFLNYYKNRLGAKVE